MAAVQDRATENAAVRAVAALGLGALLLGMTIVVLTTDGSKSVGERPPASASPSTRPAVQPRPTGRTPPAPRAVPLAAIGAFDPDGDGEENDELASAAVDRDPASSWRTERYGNFHKQGVGLVVAARRPVQLSRVVVSTDTPGFVAEIRAGGSRVGPFRRISAAKTVAGTTRFETRRARARYVMVWITDVPDGTAAQITELRVVARPS